MYSLDFRAVQSESGHIFGIKELKWAEFSGLRLLNTKNVPDSDCTALRSKLYINFQNTNPQVEES